VSLLVAATGCRGPSDDSERAGPLDAGVDTAFADAGESDAGSANAGRPDARAVAETLLCPAGQHPVSTTGRPVAELTQDVVEELDSIQCQVDDTCDSTTCGASGRCAVIDGRVQCLCSEGYAGPDCRACAPGFVVQAGVCAMQADCSAVWCSGHGSCEIVNGSLSCACETGVAGDACDRCAAGYHNTPQGCVLNTRCVASSCSGHGTCTEVDNDAVCACQPGFFGDNCSQTCGDRACGAGQCRIENNRSVCVCSVGFDPATNCTSCATGYSPDGAGGCQRHSVCAADSCNGRGVCAIDPTNSALSCSCDAGWGGAACDSCAPGFVMQGGACVARQSCTPSSCSGKGSCSDDSGFAVCHCSPGFAGRDCSIPVAPTRLRVLSLQKSLRFGETAQLDFEVDGIGNFGGTFTWAVTSGGGTLRPGGSSRVPPTYAATTAGDQPEYVVITATPTCCPDKAFDVGFAVIPGDRIPRTGQSSETFAGLDDAVTAFMRFRCVGAAALSVQRYGKPVYQRGFGRMQGRATLDTLAGCGTDEEHTFTQGAALVQPSTPFGLASVGKVFTAAAVRRAVAARISPQNPGSVTDAQIEAARLLDPALDLLPEALRTVLSGSVPPPVDLSVDGDPACGLPAGADPRWQQITVGHLIGHQAGLDRELLSVLDTLLPNLASMRGYDTAADWMAQEGVFNAAQLLEAKSKLPAGISNPIFVPWWRPGSGSIDEALLLTAGRCLQSDPGTARAYSNVGYMILGRIIEHVHPSGVFAERFGDPGSYVGSALDAFVETELGITAGGKESAFGIYSDPRYDGVTTFTPEKRRWFTSTNSYRNEVGSNRWPVCDLVGDSCSFAFWRNNRSARLNSQLETEAVTPYQASTGVANDGWAGLAAELPLYLRLMKDFWVADSMNDPGYGSARNGNWTTPRSHTGLLGDGVRSLAMQVGYTKSAALDFGEHAVRIQVSNGEIQEKFDFTASDPRLVCGIPEGVDFVFAINQAADKKCGASPPAGVTPTRNCSDEYGYASDFIKYGLCQVDWSQVNLVPNIWATP